MTFLENPEPIVHSAYYVEKRFGFQPSSHPAYRCAIWLRCSVSSFSRVMLQTLLVCAAVWCSPSRTDAQPVIDSLLVAARERAEAGDTAAALELFERATDAAPRHVEALYARASFNVRTLRLGLGNVPRVILTQRLLTRGSELAPKDARFVLELGRLRLRTPLLRADGERLLSRALTIARSAGDAPLIAECASEYGTVYMGRYRSTRNRYVYKSGLVFNPHLARARFTYTREFLEHDARPLENAGEADRDAASRLFREALKAEPRHAASTVGLLSLLYDEARFDEMRSLANSAHRTPAVRTAKLPDGRFLERVRSDSGYLAAVMHFGEGLAAWRSGTPQDAHQAFEMGLAKLAEEERREVLDIGRLLREGDSVRVAGLNEAARTATTQGFWDVADPLLSTPVNESRLEYFARIAVTMLRYDDLHQERRGWRTDRGQIVVRYGEPPIEVLFPPVSDVLAGDVTGRTITVFRYPALEQEFVFSGAPTLSDVSFAGDFRWVAESARRDEPFRLDNVAAVRSVDTLPVQITRFRGRQPSEYLVVSAGSVPVRRFYEGVELDEGSIAVNAFGGQPGRMRSVGSQSIVVSLPATKDPLVVRVDTLPVGDFRLQLEAIDPAVGRAAARARIELSLAAAKMDILQLSDVMLGRAGPGQHDSPRGWSDASIRPLGALELSPRDTVALYWETYGLKADTTTSVRFDVALRVDLLEITRSGGRLPRALGAVSDLVGLSPEGESQLAVRFSRGEALGQRDRVPVFFTLSLGTAPAGRYRLTVSVTDRTSGQRAESQRDFRVLLAHDSTQR